MIVTLTANPSLDRTIETERFVREGVNRTTTTHVDAGGKGVNVTRALTANGFASIAVLPSGGPEGAQLLALLDAEQLAVRAVPIRAAIRSNITIAEPNGATTKFNEPGPLLADDELDQLDRALLAAAAGADWAVLSGSLPRGVPTNLYARLTDRLHEAGVRVAVDASGEVLNDALPATPDLIKPNREELEQATGLPAETIQETLQAIDRIRLDGARAVLASLGPDGAVLVDETGRYHAGARANGVPRSTVGAGDSLLAGFLSQGGVGAEALAEGVAWGTAAVTLPGSRMPRHADIDRTAVQITVIEEEYPHESARHA